MIGLYDKIIRGQFGRHRGGKMVGQNRMMVAFIFDSGRLGSNSYGEVIFEHIMSGLEITKNPNKIIVSLGDILVNGRYVDIEPYVINNDFCTVDFNAFDKAMPFKDYPFCWVVEDICKSIALEIDQRLKKELRGYIGITEIDIYSENTNKQFWKRMIREFAVKENTITAFQNPDLTGRFIYEECAIKLGYQVDYSSDAESCNIEDLEILQSAFVKSESDLQIRQSKKSYSGADRDLMNMNFSLNRELQIAGALIWKSVVEISRNSFHKEDWEPPLVEESFFTLYHAAQGVERLQKIVVELLCKKHHIKQEEKRRIDDLLLTHNHCALNTWIEETEDIRFSTSIKRLFNILQKFYNNVRYLRYSDDQDRKQLVPEYYLLKELAKGSKSEDYDHYIKNFFGKMLGEIAHSYYELLSNLCTSLNIFVNELYAFSAATIVFYGQHPVNLYEEYMHRQTEKKELLYWLISKGGQYPYNKFFETEAIDIDPEEINSFLVDFINNPDNCELLHETIDNIYDEMCSSDKALWKKHVAEVEGMIANPHLMDTQCFEGEDSE